MISKRQFGFMLVGALALLALGGAAFIGSGIYNIGADDHHTKLVLAIIEQLRDRSIGLAPTRSKRTTSRIPNALPSARNATRRSVLVVIWPQG